MKVAIAGPIAGLSEAEQAHLFTRALPDQEDVQDTVRSLLERVRREGDAALFDLARRLDGAHLDTLAVPRDEWQRAAQRLAAPERAALERAAVNIERFHKALLPEPTRHISEPGVSLERRWVPVGRAGVYAPGGRAAYPSSVLMGVVAARAAGVDQVIVCSPPSPDGRVSDGVLAAAWLGGADRLFALGGAGAIAALAYGTESVPQVDVIVGPGNRWVNEAKQQVAGWVRIDSPAGPSELLVLADAGADPDVIARELVAQAEHDPDAAVVLVTPAAELLSSTRARLEARVAAADRRDVAEAALAANGALLLATDPEQALLFANAYAPEHLLLLVDEPGPAIDRLRTAGTVFVGATSSVAFGDYMTGANHVLPTAGRARSFSGLATDHFMRSFTVQRIDPVGAAALAADVRRLAELEGLPAHATAAWAAGGHS
ncbi:MAG: histidinol dehydrogenase [Gemmatimonadota bacterium]